MLKLLKVFGRGILTTLLLPVILLVLCSYGIYCIVVFIVMFFIGVVDFFKGKSFNGDMIEDLEAKRMILEKEKADEESKEMLNILYKNALTQLEMDHPRRIKRETIDTYQDEEGVNPEGLEETPQSQETNEPEQSSNDFFDENFGEGGEQ